DHETIPVKFRPPPPSSSVVPALQQAQGRERSRTAEAGTHRPPAWIPAFAGMTFRDIIPLTLNPKQPLGVFLENLLQAAFGQVERSDRRRHVLDLDARIIRAENDFVPQTSLNQAGRNLFRKDELKEFLWAVVVEARGVE